MIHSPRRMTNFAVAAALCWCVCSSGGAAKTTASAFLLQDVAPSRPLDTPARGRQSASRRSVSPLTRVTTIKDELTRKGNICKWVTPLAALNDNKRATDECSLDDKEIFSCLAKQGYREATIRIDRVMVAEIESLRDSFPSFENEGDTGSNMIKFSKRLRRKHLHHPALTVAENTFNSTTDRGRSVAKREYGGNGGDDVFASSSTHTVNMEYNRLVGPREVVLVDTVRTDHMSFVSRAFHRAGPRQLLHFEPESVNAAIVTCGGLCPGMNNVIRELVHTLYYLYGVNEVWGVTGGFNGFLGKEDYDPILLTNAMVENIHHEGGTVLRSSRGGFDETMILKFLRQKKIDQLYVIGGDGTHRAAYKISQACRESKMNVAIAGIPKTIDNDVDYIDRSFGFVSAVEAAQNSIRTAKTEAQCNMPNGIGIIKLMGRSAGFLAAYAALGSGDADCVLVPEVDIVLEGPDGILPFIRQRLKEQKYAVIVVAEGAGEELVGQSTITDAGGNKKLPPIGEFIRDRIVEYFATLNEECTVKYIDPSYMVRSVPANAADSLYCMTLALNAVHGAMAGYTGFTTGLVNNRVVYVPIPQLVSTSPRSLNPFGQTWERVLAMTGQPNTAVRADDDIDSDVDIALEADGETRVEFPARPEPTLH